VIAGAWDLLIHIAVPDTDGLYTFVVDRLTQRAEVADVRTNVVYEHVRSAHIDPAGQDPASAG
jgi:DNA-binding Lrp family transcriptional regulator